MTTASIIIPAFNQGRFLAQAIESALAQTHPEVEVVVIDDGSTDDTPQVAARFGDRIKYIRQDNTGLPGARNRGFRESTGEYLCFLDSDDFLHPEKIARQAALLDADPQLGFVYCDLNVVNEAGEPVPDVDPIANLKRQLSGDIFPALMEGGYFPPHTVLIRRRVVDQVGGFDPALGGHADYDLWLRVAGAGHRAAFECDRLVFYRTYASSMSRDGRHMAQTRIRTFAKMARLFPDRVAAALHQLQQSTQDLFTANQWLTRRWEEVLAKAGSAEAGAADDGSQHFSFIRNFSQGRVTRGQPEQAAVWDVTLDGATGKAILLQPPAELTFNVPTGAAGFLSTAAVLHPEVWNKPDAGGCEFHLRVDGRLALVVALDPVHLPTDRRWHEIKLHLPENPAGRHQITFETRAIGPSAAFRWAMWRAPRFSWKDPDPAAAPAAGRRAQSLTVA